MLLGPIPLNNHEQSPFNKLVGIWIDKEGNVHSGKVMISHGDALSSPLALFRATFRFPFLLEIRGSTGFRGWEERGKMVSFSLPFISPVSSLPFTLRLLFFAYAIFWAGKRLERSRVPKRSEIGNERGTRVETGCRSKSIWNRVASLWFAALWTFLIELPAKSRSRVSLEESLVISVSLSLKPNFAKCERYREIAKCIGIFPGLPFIFGFPKAFPPTNGMGRVELVRGK